MTACPHCQRTLPADYDGRMCPFCGKSLRPSLRPHGITPFVGMPAAGGRKSERTPAPAVAREIAEDSWGLSDAPPASKPDAERDEPSEPLASTEVAPVSEPAAVPAANTPASDASAAVVESTEASDSWLQPAVSPRTAAVVPSNAIDLSRPPASAGLPGGGGTGSTSSRPASPTRMMGSASETSGERTKSETGNGSSIPLKSKPPAAASSSEVAAPRGRPSARPSGPAAETADAQPVSRAPGERLTRIALIVGGLAVTTLAALSASDPSRAIAWAIPGLTALIVAIAPMTHASRAVLAFAPASAALLVHALAMPGLDRSSAIALAACESVLPAALWYRALMGRSRAADTVLGAGLALGLAWLLLPAGGGILSARGGAWAATHLGAIGFLGVSALSLIAVLAAGPTAGFGAWATLVTAWTGFHAFVHYVPSVGGETETLAWPNAIAAFALTAICAFTGAALIASRTGRAPARSAQ